MDPKVLQELEKAGVPFEFKMFCSFAVESCPETVVGEMPVDLGHGHVVPLPICERHRQEVLDRHAEA